jgi:hypothetical protein
MFGLARLLLAWSIYMIFLDRDHIMIVFLALILALILVIRAGEIPARS